MKSMLVSSMLLVVVFTGCARFTTRQVDETINRTATNEITRRIITKATATTFFEAKSDLAKFRASQTDKSQTATVGTLGQETTSTNLAPMIEAVSTGVAKGLATGLKSGL